MPSPFPGMDPWLESPDIWPGFHDKLINETVRIMQPQLRARGYSIHFREFAFHSGKATRTPCWIFKRVPSGLRLWSLSGTHRLHVSAVAAALAGGRRVGGSDPEIEWAAWIGDRSDNVECRNPNASPNVE